MALLDGAFTGTQHKLEGTEELPEKLATPKEIKAHLDKFVVGQERAKKIMAVGVHNHYKRTQTQRKMSKSNMLFVGPSGSGKTLMAQTIAESLKKPFIILDCSSLTQNGYTGGDVDSVLFDLYESTGRNIKKAERGIVFLDEVDKIKSNRPDGNLDVNGRGVQQNLLKMIEGCTVALHKNGNWRNSDGEKFIMDSSSILFMASGAFCGLDEIANRRLENSTQTDSTKNSDDIICDDLVKFGMIPEFIGRFPIITVFQQLDETSLLKILNNSQSSPLDEYRKLFELNEVVLDIDESALAEIARLAFERGIGARGLKSILEDLLTETMFEVPGSNICRVEICKDTVLKLKAPKLCFKTENPTPLADSIE